MTSKVARGILPLVCSALFGGCTESEIVPAGDPEADRTSVSVPDVMPAPTCDTPRVLTAVARFGERIQSVSLLAPDSVLEAAVRSAYEPVVTRELLAGWTADPASAPGRDVSSPWPDRIDVTSVEAADGGVCRVEGDLVYVTSVEAAQGGAADRVPVVLELADEAGWRVSAYEAGADIRAGGGRLTG